MHTLVIPLCRSPLPGSSACDRIRRRPPPPDAEATLALPVSSDPDAPYRAILTTGTPWNVAVRPRPAPAYTS